MLDRFPHIAVWVEFCATVAVVLINASYMIISPEAWFKLPRWLGLQGVLTSDRYGSGWGGLQVRILGMMIIGTLAWIVYGLLLSKGAKLGSISNGTGGCICG